MGFNYKENTPKCYDQVQTTTPDIEFISSTMVYLNEVFCVLGFFSVQIIDILIAKVQFIIGLNIDLKVSLPYTLYDTRVFCSNFMIEKFSKILI